MPTISRFYGIEIVMFFRDHAPPHFHARYGGDEAKVRIADGEMTAGSLPPRARRLVRHWWRRYKEHIERSWDSLQRNGVAIPVPALE